MNWVVSGIRPEADLNWRGRVEWIPDDEIERIQWVTIIQDEEIVEQDQVE